MEIYLEIDGNFHPSFSEEKFEYPPFEKSL